MYEDSYIHVDSTGLALVDGRSINDGAPASLIIIPDGADPESQIAAIRRSDFRMTLAHTSLLVSIMLIGLTLVMEWMIGANFLSEISPALPIVISLVPLLITAGLIIFAKSSRPRGLLRADICLRDILTPKEISRLRAAKRSERPEDYLDLQERIAAKHGRRLGFDPQNKVID